MSMRQSEIVGAGISQQTKPAPIPMDDENATKESAEQLREVLEGMTKTVSRPWGTYARAVEFARREYERLEAHLADQGAEYEEYNKHFKERESDGWYLRRITQFSKIAEEMLEEGNITASLELAALVGEAVTEARIKFQWDEFAIFGQERLSELRNASASKRRHYAEVRFLLVLSVLETQTNKTAAFGTVAEALGVSDSTVKQDFYRMSKLYGPID